MGDGKEWKLQNDDRVYEMQHDPADTTTRLGLGKSTDDVVRIFVRDQEHVAIETQQDCQEDQAQDMSASPERGFTPSPPLKAGNKRCRSTPTRSPDEKAAAKTIKGEEIATMDTEGDAPRGTPAKAPLHPWHPAPAGSPAQIMLQRFNSITDKLLADIQRQLESQKDKTDGMDHRRRFIQIQWSCRPLQLGTAGTAFPENETHSPLVPAAN